MAKSPPPHSAEAERAVLGALLLEPERLGQLAGRLSPSDFHLIPHRHIYASLLAVAKEGGRPDALTVSSHLRQAGLLDETGGFAFLAELEDLTLLTERVNSYADLVSERACRRRLMAIAAEAIRNAAGTPRQLSEILSSLQDEVLALQARLSTSGPGRSIGDILADDEPRPNPSRVGWGFTQADRLTLGFAEETLTVLAGQSKMGKSSLAASVIRWNARRGRRVLLRSIEEFQAPWGRRLLAQEAGVSLHHLREAKVVLGDGRYLRQLEAGEAARVVLAQEEMASWRVTIVDSRPPKRGVAAPDDGAGIVSTVLAHHREEQVDLAVIDHLQDARGEEGWDGAMKTLRAFREIARAGIPVLVLSQVSPKVESRAARFNPKTERADWLSALRPTMTDLASASGLASIPDVITFVFREDFFSKPGDPPTGKGELIIRANRYGPPDKIIPLRFNAASTAFEGNS